MDSAPIAPNPAPAPALPPAAPKTAPATPALEQLPLSAVNYATLRYAFLELHHLVQQIDFARLRERINQDPAEVRQLVSLLSVSQPRLEALEAKNGAQPGGLTPEHLGEIEGQLHLL